MSKYLSRHGDLRNISVQADVETIGPKLVARITVAADVRYPNGRTTRLKSEQLMDLQNFVDGCAKEAGIDPEQKPQEGT